LRGIAWRMVLDSCQKEADINHRESIEAFRNNAEASTEEEGDRSAGWRGVKAVVRSAVPWEKQAAPRLLREAYSLLTKIEEMRCDYGLLVQ